jgi:hypothetical protein
MGTAQSRKTPQVSILNHAKPSWLLRYRYKLINTSLVAFHPCVNVFNRPQAGVVLIELFKVASVDLLQSRQLAAIGLEFHEPSYTAWQAGDAVGYAALGGGLELVRYAAKVLDSPYKVLFNFFFGYF